MKKTVLLLASLALVSGCDGKDEGLDNCSASSDSDDDGIDDCAEAELGTDPSLADSDGDGLSDLEEVDCVSHPLDAEEQCYAGGWEHNDPSVASTGTEVGDVMANFSLIDQCGEEVDIHDFFGEYHILYLTAAW